MEQDVRDRLAQLIELHGASYAALSRMLRRNDAYLQQYVRRGTPRLLAERDRKLLAAYLRVDEAELGGAGGPVLAEVRRLEVEASAGPGAIVGDEAADGTMQLDPRLLETLRLDPRHAAMLRARGDSMEPAIRDGDQIIVDERDRAVAAAPAIFVLRLDGDLLVKRVARLDGGFRVTSDNPAYPPRDSAAVEIVGRVVWLARTLR